MCRVPRTARASLYDKKQFKITLTVLGVTAILAAAVTAVAARIVSKAFGSLY